MDTHSRPGILRYTLTKHFQDNGLVAKWWFAAINPVLERAVARATGNIRLPSQEDSLEYLERYRVEQSIKELDPSGDYRSLDILDKNYSHPDLDWNLENYRQENHPLKSKRWSLLRRVILKRDNYQCLKCGVKDDRLHVDHIKPRSRYPLLIWEPDNLQTLCKACNMAKRINETDYRQHGAA